MERSRERRRVPIRRDERSPTQQGGEGLAADASGNVFLAAGPVCVYDPSGAPVDKRTDIWSFGCIFYECLTGKRAFCGTSISETVSTIIEAGPDWTLLPAETPLFARATLKRCLQKDTREHLHDIADVRIGIGEEEVVGAGRGKTSPFLGLGLALIFVLSMLAIVFGSHMLTSSEVALAVLPFENLAASWLSSK